MWLHLAERIRQDISPAIATVQPPERRLAVLPQEPLTIDRPSPRGTNSIRHSETRLSMN